MNRAKKAVPETERVALVVEDNDKSAAVLRLFLEAEGFAVLRARSAEEALMMASSNGSPWSRWISSWAAWMAGSFFFDYAMSPPWRRCP